MGHLAAILGFGIPLVALGIVVIVLVANSVAVVGGTQIAVLERRYFGRRLPDGRVIAETGQIGVQAKTLGPGVHFLIPFLYKARKVEFTVVRENQVGIVESIDGNPVSPGKIFAKVVEGHNAFQDAEAFLKNGGEKGPQNQILAPGNYRINTALFKVSFADAVEIPPGKIGIVAALDGQPIARGRLLGGHIDGHKNFEDGQGFLLNGGQRGPQLDILLPGTYRINTKLFEVSIRDACVIPSGKVGLVTALDGSPLPADEYVAKQVDGHGDFQDAAKFLELGGQRGPQLDTLRPSTYYINPLMFEVELTDVTEVERGEVAVIVSNVGAEPTAEMISSFSEAAKDDEDKGPVGERYVVPKGYRGIQDNVLGPGRYYFNKRAYIAYIVDTTNQTVDWDEDENTKFDPLRVISKDGFPIKVSVKVVVRVRPEQAPLMVAKIGSIDNLIQHVIHPMIDSSFRNQASATSAMNFMQERQEEQNRAYERTKLELEKYHVECVSVLICQIDLPQDLMDTQTRKVISQQQNEMYQAESLAQVERAETEKKRAIADQQPSLVKAEIGVQIAKQNKEQAIVEAQGKGESLRLMAEGEAAGITAKGKAEGERIAAIGEATAQAYEQQNKAIGGAGVTAIEVVKRLAEGQVKITPDLLVSGGGSGSGLGELLSLFLAQTIQGAEKSSGVAAVGAVAPSVESAKPETDRKEEGSS